MKALIGLFTSMCLATGISATSMTIPKPNIPVKSTKPVEPVERKVVTTVPENNNVKDQYRNMTLVWKDEFSGNAINKNEWGMLDQRYTYNKELQLYTSGNVSVNGGTMNIVTKRLNNDYTSGAIIAKNMVFTDGRIDIRAKMPSGQHVISAFWMRPVNNVIYPEIDILEYLTTQPKVMYATLHYKHNSKEYAHASMSNIEDLSKGFHVYSVIRHDGQLVWLIDGKTVYTHYDNSNGTPMYLEIDNSVGGVWVGNPDGKKSFPVATLQVDYVHWYEYNDKHDTRIFQ